MSSGKNHLYLGLIVVLFINYIFIYYFTHPSFIQLVICTSLCLMFSVWPDVDIKSMGQKFFYSIFFIVDIIFIYFNEFKIAAYFGLIIILPILAKHRGWTHSIPAMILIPVPILVYPIYIDDSFDFSGLPYYLSAVAGYFSHLVYDGKIMLK